MSGKKVLGRNFAGLTAALAVRHELRGDVDVRVVAASERFLFSPSLIWLPSGRRGPADITFALAPVLESHGIDFVHAEATALDLDGRKVRQQRRHHPRRQDAPAPQARRPHPRPASPRHETRLREILPLESQPRLRRAAMTR